VRTMSSVHHWTHLQGNDVSRVARPLYRQAFGP
jgi:hypothetical protein